MVVQEYYPRDERVRRYVNTLLGVGARVTVYSLRRKGEVLKECKQNLKIIRFPLGKSRSGNIRYLMEYIAFFILSLLALTWLTLRDRPDIVHVHNLPDVLVFSALVPKIFGSKVILDLHEISPECFMQKFGIGTSNWLYRFSLLLERLSILFATNVITIHEPAREIILQRNLGLRDVYVIMNVVDESEVKVNFPKSTGKFVIVYNGTLNTNVNISLTIQAISQLKSEIPDLEFRIYGEGPAQRSLEALVQKLNLRDRVKFLGYKPFEKLIGELASADLGILTPDQDVYSELFFSMKMSEWIYLGIPVIASRLKTYSQYFREESIFFIEPGSLPQLREAICSVYHNPTLRQNMVQNARADYEHIRWGIMESRYLHLLDGLVGS